MVTEAVRRHEAGAAVFAHSSPATELSMLAVFVGTGVLVTRSVDYQQFAPVVVIGSTVGLTIGTEVVHEALHLAALRRYGHAAAIRWRHLAVVPTGARIPPRDLLVAVTTPVIVISIVAGVVMLFTDRPLLVAAAGYVLVVNASVSVLDVATAITLARHPAGAVLHFDGTEAPDDALEPARADAIDRDRS